MTLPDNKGNKLQDIIRDFAKISSGVISVRGNSKAFSHKHTIWKESLLDVWRWSLLKRIFDIFFSSTFLIFHFFFVWPIIVIAIKLTTKGSIFYKQERWGKNGKKFTLYKFRTMRQDCEQFDENGAFLQVTKNDPRVTAVGRFLRRTNLDELPQFINILKGDMSVIGPRPHVTIMDQQFRHHIEGYMQRYSVKPGITGWAQVNGFRGETKDLELMKKRVEYDMWYIENWSFMLDHRIILLTIWNMLKGDKNAY